MSDFGNLYDSFEVAENALKRKDYVCAAEEFWWTEQYYEHGEFHIYIAGVEEMAATASKQWRDIIKRHLVVAMLSKSTFVMGRQCVKQLWLHKYKYTERVVSDKLQSAFDRGHSIWELAQQLFPDGKDASENMFHNFRRRDLQAKSPLTLAEMPYVLKQNLWIRNTKQLIDKKEKFIYEAAFVYDNVFAAVDILECAEDGYIAYEVKSTDSVRDVYLSDASLQYYVINTHVPLKNFYIVYLNKDYIEALDVPLNELSEKNCDIQKLFLKKSILNEILMQQTCIKQDIDKFLNIIKNRNSCPKIKIGEQCNYPYECVFKEYCSKHK